MSDEKDETKKDKFDDWRLYGNTRCRDGDNERDKKGYGKKYFKFKDRELQENTIINKEGDSVKTSLYDTSVNLGYIVKKEEDNGR